MRWTLLLGLSALPFGVAGARVRRGHGVVLGRDHAVAKPNAPVGA
ncbi:MAG TPA: hypothetical protein VHF47_05010 [Acidimicrobiales bacterium]|nr:hypothetical protein [Acidimicrobiales bacterium]